MSFQMTIAHGRRLLYSAALLTLAVLCDHSAASAEANWPQFRGPAGAGIADAEKPPTDFSPETNVAWQVDLAPGLSSPCIWNDRIFLTTFGGHELASVCIDRADGRVRWKQVAPADKIESFHPTEGSPATATPATDGQRVIVYFGSCGVLAYDLDGKELWRRILPTVRQVGDFGSGTSPVIAGNLVLVNRDQMQGSELLALDVATGAVKWKAERARFSSSFGTPAVWKNANTEEVVLPGSLEMVAYDLKSGAERWRVTGLPSAMCTTPVVSEGQLFFAGWAAGKADAPMPKFTELAEREDKNHDGFISLDEAGPITATLMPSLDKDHDHRLSKEEWDAFLASIAKGENVALAVRPGGQGNITESHVAWKYKRGLPNVASPLVYRGLMYFVRDGGMVTCLEAATGEPVYEQQRLGAPGSYYSSPVAANDVIYFCSVNGAVTALRAGPKFETLATNQLKERIAATPAIADNTLFIRTDKHLYAFKSKS